MCRYAISSLCESHRVHLHKPWNLALTWPPCGWKSFQASVSRIGRFRPYLFTLARNFPPQSAYLEFQKIHTTVVYAVGRWPKRRYATHDCIILAVCVQEWKLYNEHNTVLQYRCAFLEVNIKGQRYILLSHQPSDWYTATPVILGWFAGRTCKNE
jgi:hypothetical protein